MGGKAAQQQTGSTRRPLNLYLLPKKVKFVQNELSAGLYV